MKKTFLETTKICFRKWKIGKIHVWIDWKQKFKLVSFLKKSLENSHKSPAKFCQSPESNSIGKQKISPYGRTFAKTQNFGHLFESKIRKDSSSLPHNTPMSADIFKNRQWNKKKIKIIWRKKKTQTKFLNFNSPRWKKKNFSMKFNPNFSGKPRLTKKLPNSKTKHRQHVAAVIYEHLHV